MFGYMHLMSHVFFRLTKQMQLILIKSDINCAAHRSKKTTKQNATKKSKIQSSKTRKAD